MNPVAESKELVTEIIDVVLNAVNLQHLDKKKIGSDTPLTQEGLGLDSVDILEVIVVVEHRYGVKVPDAETGVKYFRTIGTIADFVRSNSVPA